MRKFPQAHSFRLNPETREHLAPGTICFGNHLFLGESVKAILNEGDGASVLPILLCLVVARCVIHVSIDQSFALS
jgi:hypothetical protein